ncbi:DeoR/GlpR family DNA-binding transcription regulator [Labrys sp. La1]|uniref:DeoR/GlpR family DNA-binding transcription regulator n=1 Tax=Labrys sp. La1 TaxID=3404917 RepID=UPI003EBC1945
MLAVERKTRILDLVTRNRSVVVAELSQELGVTEETIRRDLNKLEKEGLLSRTHGGAIALQGEAEDLPYRTRHLINIEAKRSIAGKASTLVRDGDAVMMDSSSTAYETLRAIGNRRDLTLITNSVRILSDPSLPPYTIMSVGGELRRRSMTFVGPLAGQTIAQFNADVALISCKAISLTGGLMEANMADADVKRAFIESAQRVCLLVDSEKFDKTALISICGFGPIDFVVTDREPSPEWRELFERNQVKLIV